MTNLTSRSVQNNPGCLIQLLWFIFIGSWASLIWVAVAWFLMLTVIGLPVGIAMINYLPKIVALREPRRQEVYQVHTAAGQTTVFVQEKSLPQVNFFLRAIYFIFIGWWFSALWLLTAWAVSVTIIGLPLAFWMIDLAPGTMTLHR